MPVTPFLWNAVVAGAWNTAILTPDGVSRKLFELQEGTPVEVQVAIDAPGPFRIRHDGMIVVPTSTRLEVIAESPDAESLARACTLCARALRSLPETPVSAAGVNVRYQFTETPGMMFDLVRTQLDGALSDAGYEVGTSKTERGIKIPPGAVNMKVTHTQGGGTLEFNFHRDSNVAIELSEWLARGEEFIGWSDQLATLMGVPDVRRQIHT